MRTIKRVLDLLGAVIGLILTAPLLAASAAAIKLTMGSPVLFRQVRPGLGGAPFTMYKFRTMLPAPGNGSPAPPDEERLTALGRFLRASSLDELPELLNVLKGNMSMVGPRPLLMAYLDRYTAEEARRHEIRPGITGWAQVNGRNAITWEEKFKLDVWYVDNRSPSLDFKILLLTLINMVKRNGIHADGHATMPEFTSTERSIDSGGKPGIVILGAGGLAREVAFFLRELAAAGQPYDLLGFVTDDGRQLGQTVVGYPVADLKNLPDEFKGCNAVIAIGDPKAVARLATDRHLAEAGLKFPNIIHPSVIWDTERVRMGDGNIICPGAILTTDVRIGSFNIINLSCTIGHDVEIADYCVIHPAVHISGNVKLRQGVLIGAGAKILQSIEVEAGAVVGAGAVVTKDVPAGEVVVGIPAKPLI